MSAVAYLAQDHGWPTRIASYDWEKATSELHCEGNTRLPGLLSQDEISKVISVIEDVGRINRVELLALPDRGCGRFHFLPAVLPAPLTGVAGALYERLVTIANQWQELLIQKIRYPLYFGEWQRQCKSAGQHRSLTRISRLRAGNFEVLSQDAEGEWVFPLRATILLSNPRHDFSGGEFVMVEQRPRMQSKPVAVPLQMGDAMIFASGHRPIQGSRGLYRGILKHGVSRVRSGQRQALDLTFHLAP